ncbi:hypothetical protein F0U60_00820 [Archangium minus]|uniref:Secreted protein n=1 Tax=Archangium minus TaxID=83450 RepID=A0ABY9WM36_9BACT|nr:hypothetical protein F0U61_00760 [Archangium violaceum]WNG42802.1 hypothetical protein F0U60_00820 [Archangium minus]
MGILGALLVAVTVNAGPVDVKTAPVFNPSICAKKRVDACGCHHVYGVRHCHPKRKSEHCESMAQVNEPSEKKATRVRDFFPTEVETAASEQEPQDFAAL